MAPLFALFLESSQFSSWMRAEKTGEEGIQLNLLSPKVSHLTSFHIPLVRTSYVAPLREGRLGNKVQLCPEEENRTVVHPHGPLLVDMVWEGIIINLPSPENKLYAFLLFRLFFLKKLTSDSNRWNHCCVLLFILW